MSIALSAKHKLGTVNGSIPKPSNSSDLDMWICCNDMVTSWILNGLSPSIAESVIYCESAAKIWSDLEDRYGIASGPKLYQLQREICMSSQGSTDVAAYFTYLRRLWYELNSLQPFPQCTCG